MVILVNEKLAAYFKENMKNGYSAAQLKETLLRADYPKKDIEEALKHVQKSAAAPLSGQDGANPETSSGSAPKEYECKYQDIKKSEIKPARPLWHYSLGMILFGILLCAASTPLNNGFFYITGTLFFIFGIFLLLYILHGDDHPVLRVANRIGIRTEYSSDEILRQFPEKSSLWTSERNTVQKKIEYEKNRRKAN